jgi:iron(III) transport system substrate-binding protein
MSNRQIEQLPPVIIGHWRSRLLVSCLVASLALCAFLGGCSKPAPRVVLYCAQDEEFAQAILADFTAKTGIDVAVKYDTEANKSVSLYQELVAEKDRPRCDVHWNNEVLSTIRLDKKGLLEAYSHPGEAGGQTWFPFAARARILIVNTRLVPPDQLPKSLLDLTQSRWKGKVAMAKPQYGTSATQAACLFDVLGPDKAKAFYMDLKRNQVQVVAGNKQVAEGVGQGQFEVGITDTDDAMQEVASGRPVKIIFPDGAEPKTSRMGTLFIPNTLAILKNCPNPEAARRLFDFLAAPEIEIRLAQSASHQIPLHAPGPAGLPPEIHTPKTVKAMDVDFAHAAVMWDEVQTFLRQEFTGL